MLVTLLSIALRLRFNSPPIQQVTVKNKKGEFENVILCTTVWTDKPRMREAYSISEFDWMVVEVNALWRRKHRTVNMKAKRIPFFCRLCNRDMVDKSELAWHRQQDLCPMYDALKDGPLKMFPVNGAKGSSEIAAVFKTYKIKLPWQNGGTGGERPEDEPSVGEVELEDVVNLTSDVSTGDSAYMSQPPMKRKKLGKFVLEETEDIRRSKQEQMPKEAAIAAKRGKGAVAEKGKGVLDGTPKPHAAPRTSTPTRATKRSTAGTQSTRMPGHPCRPSPKGSPATDPMDTMLSPPLDPRIELEGRLHLKAASKFPDCNAGSEPKKPGKPPGLYSLIEQTGDVIDLDLLTSLQRAKDAVLALHVNGTLGRKIFNAWGAFSMDPAIRVSIFPVLLV